MGKSSFERALRIAPSAGFTLLEVIIALAIMTLAFASIISVESGGISAAEKTHQMNIVSMLARDRMVQAEFEIQGKTFEDVHKEQEGTFKDPFQDYRWKMEVKEVKFPNIGGGAPASSSSSGGGSASASGGGAPGGGEIAELVTKLMTNFLSKALREVTVTIFWKRVTGEQSFSVTTYWVNLNQEFELAE